MKTFIIIQLMMASLFANAHIPASYTSTQTTENFRSPSYYIILITKEGYRLGGLLMTSNDSQLIIFPGKYKEWRRKKNYLMVHYPYYKIATVNSVRLNNPLRRLCNTRKRNMTRIDGSKELFMNLKESLTHQKN